jgi:FkbM family methyltransferase
MKLFSGLTRRNRKEEDPPNRLQSPFASEEDVYYCFRLLLGRAPSAKEWHGHRLTAGTRLRDIVSKFLASPEFRSQDMAVPSLARSKHQVVKAQGLRFLISTEDKVSISLRMRSEYEPGVTAVLRRALKVGMTFLDVGANIGFFSLIGSRLVGPTGRVFAVEPYPYNVKVLLSNLRLNACDNVEVLPFAAADSAGLRRYDDSAGNSGQILDAPAHASAALDECLVYAMPLDRMLPGGTRVDVVKMDIEGAEHLALKGMRQIFSDRRPVIVSEIAADFLLNVSNVALPTYLRSLLLDQEYRLGIIEPDGNVECYGQSIAAIAAAHDRKPGMCLDVVAYPAGFEANVLSPSRPFGTD